MDKKLIRHAMKYFFVILVFYSCSTSNWNSTEYFIDGKYDPVMVMGNPSEELNRAARSIKLINSIAFYKKYSFPPASNYHLRDINKKILEKFDTEISTFNKDASGTAIILSENNDSIILLTCAHILTFPDTLISYFSYKNGIKSEYVESISFKVGQSNYATFTESGEVDILLISDEIDSAILIGKIKSSSQNELSVFPFKFGNSSQIDWGNFVYVLGYPLHNKTITSGIISKPGKINQKFFVLDAAVNRGSSGSVVLAIRDGVPNFELVGMISWVPSEKFIYIRPAQLNDNQQYQTDTKYSGEFFISETETIRYGITKAVMVDEIKKFLAENSELLTRKGFDIKNIIETN